MLPLRSRISKVLLCTLIRAGIYALKPALLIGCSLNRASSLNWGGGLNKSIKIGKLFRAVVFDAYLITGGELGESLYGR